MIGVSNKVISKWEKDVAKPKKDAIRRLTEALEVDNNYFVPIQHLAVPMLVYKNFKSDKIQFEYDEWKKVFKYEDVVVELVNNYVFDEDISSLSQKEIDQKYFLFHNTDEEYQIIKMDYTNIVDGKRYAVNIEGELSVETLYNDDDGGFYLTRINKDKITELIAKGYSDKKLLDEIEKHKYIQRIKHSGKNKDLIQGVVVSSIYKIG
jgi:transcriptional regulator with XRE-family HTH domain